MPQKPIEPHSCKSCCPIAHVLDAVGDRWSMLIIRDILFKGLHSFKELSDSYEGISSNVLTNRLRKLEKLGLICSCEDKNDKRRRLYYMSEAGKQFAYPMIALVRWGRDYLPDTDIPPDVEETLALDTDTIVAQVLERVRLWEKEYLSSD